MNDAARPNARGTQGTPRLRVDDAGEAARDREQGRSRGAPEGHGARMDLGRGALRRPQGRPDQPRRTRTASRGDEDVGAGIEDRDDGALRGSSTGSNNRAESGRRVRMLKRVAMVLVAALAAPPRHRPRFHHRKRSGDLATTGTTTLRPRRSPQARTPQTPMSSDVETRPATTTIEWRHGAVVRADGRSAAGEEVVAQRATG